MRNSALWEIPKEFIYNLQESASAMWQTSLQVLRFSLVTIIPLIPDTHLHFHQKDKWAKPGNLRTKLCSFGYRVALDRKVLSHSWGRVSRLTIEVTIQDAFDFLIPCLESWELQTYLVTKNYLLGWLFYNFEITIEYIQRILLHFKVNRIINTQ
jgi:hypothetical protein